MLRLAILLTMLLAAPVAAAGERDCPGDKLVRDGREHAVLAAPLEELDLAVQRSAPPQYVLNGVAGVPDGCTRFHQAWAERQGDRILVTVTNVRPTDPDLVCTMIYGMQPFQIPLGSGLEPGQQYRVIVNGQERLTFTAE